jgi:hypothetical protein
VNANQTLLGGMKPGPKSFNITFMFELLMNDIEPDDNPLNS